MLLLDLTTSNNLSILNVRRASQAEIKYHFMELTTKKMFQQAKTYFNNVPQRGIEMNGDYANVRVERHMKSIRRTILKEEIKKPHQTIYHIDS